MGRDYGYLALIAAVAGGAEAMMIPEQPSSVEDLIAEMRRAHEFGKSHFISEVVAQLSAISEQCYEVRLILQPHLEGSANGSGSTEKLRKPISQSVHAPFRGSEAVILSVLGYIQGGGTPTTFDRLLATRSGAAVNDSALTPLHYPSPVGSALAR
jgi:ATP-dependent phosphofructokinase / diphosphate-dependent phosphofructokinase